MALFVGSMNPAHAADDHGNTAATATFAGPNSTLVGNIETVGDWDYFRVVFTRFDRLSVQRTDDGSSTYGTVAALVKLDSYGETTLAGGTVLDWSYFVNPGTYYLRVSNRSSSPHPGTGPYRVRISQLYTDSLSLSPTSQSVVRAGATHSFTITSGVQWYWSCGVNWVTSSEDNVQSGNQTFTYNVAPNPGTASRTAVITVVTGTSGITGTHTITQAGVEPTLEVNPSAQTVAGGGATHSFSVTSNTSWSWSVNAGWVTTSESASQTGNQTFTYAVAANPGSTNRTAVITFNSGGLTRTHTITQTGATLEVSPSAQTVAGGGATHSFSVTSNISWSWSVNAGWITTSEFAIQTGNQAFTYGVAANPSITNRTAVITFNGGGLTRTHTITQTGDADGDGVADSEDVYPNDATKYVKGWKTASLGRTAATNSPLALMWDGMGAWTVNNADQLQLTYWSSSAWQHLVFTASAKADRAKGLAADSTWNIVYYIGTDAKLYATYYSSGVWRNAMLRPGPFARVHLVDTNKHVVWTRKSDGTDAVVFWSGSAWTETSAPNGGAVAYSGVDGNRSQVGWKSDGSLVERYLSGSSWLTRAIPGGGTIGAVVGDARSSYGYDAGYRYFYYGTTDRALGWTSLKGGSGSLHPGKVWPGSPTWVATSSHWVLCRDGVGSGNKLRVFYYSGGQWRTAVIAAYGNWKGDQAGITSTGRMFFVDPSTGAINCIYY